MKPNLFFAAALLFSPIGVLLAARFGLFVNYGPVVLTGQEISWSRPNSNPKCPDKREMFVEVYDNLFKEFNPTTFKVADWAGIAKNVGMNLKLNGSAMSIPALDWSVTSIKSAVI